MIEFIDVNKSNSVASLANEPRFQIYSFAVQFVHTKFPKVPCQVVNLWVGGTSADKSGLIINQNLVIVLRVVTFLTRCYLNKKLYALVVLESFGSVSSIFNQLVWYQGTIRGVQV